MKRGAGAALLPFHTAGVREAGCDEAGRGCLAGPVFAAAVILPPDFTDDTLTDSKQMSAKARYRLREKIEREAGDVAFAIVLYTACDLGNDKDRIHDITDLNSRARQNVVFEHGYMCALLGRSRVCAVVEEGVEIPGDLSGVVYVPYDDKGKWRFDVVREMRAVGLDADANNLV